VSAAWVARGTGAAVCTAILLALPLPAQEPLDLTLENIFTEGRGGVSDVAIAPDGSEIAFVANSAEGSGIHLIASDGSGEPRFLYEGGNPVWSPDGGSLALRRDGALWIAEPRPGAVPVRLSGELEGAHALAFSPDGGRVAFYSTTSGFQDIWLAPSDGSALPRQLTEGAMTADDDRFVPGWSPDGRTIAYVSNRDDFYDDDVWVVDVQTGATRQISSTVTAIGSTPVWSHDGTRIAVLGTDEDDYWFLDIADIFLLDPAGGPPEKVEMQVYATAYRYRPFWSGDGERIFFPYMERGEHDLWVVPADGGVATRVTHIGGVLSDISASDGAERFAFARTTPVRGPELYVQDAAGGLPERLTSLANAWSDVEPPLEVSFRSFDGLYIQGYLYLPDQAQEGMQCPALVEVHGGGTNSYLNGLNLTEQYLASRGYVVLAINYRGGSGFGRPFQAISDEDWLNDQARDPGGAAAYLRTKEYVNGEVGIYGYSYGGMQTMAAITRTPDAFDAAVPMAGIYSEALTFPDMDRLGKVFSVDGHGGLPEERPEIYEKTNTLDRMDRITVPLLIMHGELDVRAPFSNFELAVRELEEHDKEYESHTYPEGHGFRDPANRVDLYRRVEDFFGRTLSSCSAGG